MQEETSGNLEQGVWMPASAASLESLESSATPWLGVSQPLQHRDSEG
jgi:hypothetical protein